MHVQATLRVEMQNLDSLSYRKLQKYALDIGVDERTTRMALRKIDLFQAIDAVNGSSKTRDHLKFVFDALDGVSP